MKSQAWKKKEEFLSKKNLRTEDKCRLWTEFIGSIKSQYRRWNSISRRIKYEETRRVQWDWPQQNIPHNALKQSPNQHTEKKSSHWERRWCFTPSSYIIKLWVPSWTAKINNSGQLNIYPNKPESYHDKGNWVYRHSRLLPNRWG